MVTFFQTITGLIGQKIDGSQQGGGGGENPNPPIVNDPKITITTKSKYRLTPNMIYMPPIEINSEDMQDNDPTFKFQITAGSLDEIFYTKSFFPKFDFAIDNAIFEDLSRNHRPLSVTAFYEKDNTILATSNTLTVELM